MEDKVGTDNSITAGIAKVDQEDLAGPLSPWWRHAVMIVLLLGLGVLTMLTALAYKDAPPIPAKVVDSSGHALFTRADILGGQQVWLKYGLMENGSVWGHGAYLGPDFSADYLHALGRGMREALAPELYGRRLEYLNAAEKAAVDTEVGISLKVNRYNPQTQALIVTPGEASTWHRQTRRWTAYFAGPVVSAGLPSGYIKDPQELKRLTAFFAWTAWAAVANRPDRSYSYTNNWPYDPTVGNVPPAAAYIWSALSLIALLAGTALVLFVFGRYSGLAWAGKTEHIHPQLLPGAPTAAQKATIKYFLIAALLFLAQVLVGGALAHYRADPASFYGFNLARVLPSSIIRTWHLQLAIFWVATSFVAGGLFLAAAIGGRQPKGQVAGINILFVALIVVAVGSLLGEYLGINQMLGKVWFWFGHQGWEFLELGRAWQILLVAGLILWVGLIRRALAPARADAKRREISALFLYTAIAIPLFYVPAMFYNSITNLTVVDTWRFWVIHLWVEGFFELLVTMMVAAVFYELGVITHQTAARVVYLDAILILAGGVTGTGHHWYWTGQSTVSMALAATFSALEIVPLTLLALHAWDFTKLTHGKCEICGRELSIPHKGAFRFLLAVGFWNFVGAGIFGFLINLPIISYFEVGTMLTPNHAHAALMGVFGMLAVALMVFAWRQVLSDAQWVGPEKYIRVSFFGLNIGLALMMLTTLFPGGSFSCGTCLTTVIGTPEARSLSTRGPFTFWNGSAWAVT